MRLASVSIAVVAVVWVGVGLAAEDEEGFTPLVRGDDPAKFELVKIGPETISIEDGVVRLTGKPTGYFATRDRYQNYVLRFEWMYERPENLASDEEFRGNSGVLLNIQGEPKVWPRSIEFQLANREVGKVYPIGGARCDGRWDRDAYAKAIKPVGQWNREEVTCRNGEMTCTLNGVEVTRGSHAQPDRGQIGWQSEGAPIRFRNLEIKRLD